MVVNIQTREPRIFIQYVRMERVGDGEILHCARSRFGTGRQRVRGRRRERRGRGNTATSAPVVDQYTTNRCRSLDDAAAAADAELNATRRRSTRPFAPRPALISSHTTEVLTQKLSCDFFYSYTFLAFFLSLSVCLVLWASLPEIKIDDDDDDDDVDD